MCLTSGFWLVGFGTNLHLGCSRKWTSFVQLTTGRHVFPFVSKKIFHKLEKIHICIYILRIFMYKKEKFLYRGNSNQMESFLCVFGIDNIFLTISLQYKQYWYHFWLVIERSKIFVLASGRNKYNDFTPQPSPCVLSLYLIISKSQNRMSRLSDPNKSYCVLKQPTMRVRFPCGLVSTFQSA